MSLANFKHTVWTFLGHYSFFLPFFRFYQILTNGGIGVVSPSTDIVIEGYPRSANTFAVAAFLLTQQRQVKVAHHIHGPAQIIWAARHDIPTLVLIREPSDSVLSLIVRQTAVSLEQAFRNYIRFYERVLPYSDSYVIADFDETTSDYGGVIGRVNSRFGTSFTKFEHTDKNVQRCYQLIEEMDRRDTGHEDTTMTTVARPSSRREKLKVSLSEELENENFQHLITRAEVIYSRMTLNREKKYGG
jgi:hypothetical protein